MRARALFVLFVLACLEGQVRGICTSCCVTGSAQCTCVSQFNMFQSAACTLCLQRCATCSSQSSCLTCEPSYYISSGQCLPCLSFCLTCLGPSDCATCWTGYYFDSSSGVCSPCTIPNAQSCSSATLVSTCKPSYYLSGNSCSACRPNCINCIDGVSCMQCLPGFVIKVGAGQYCDICPNFCTACSSVLSSMCTACLVGYSLSPAAACILIPSCTTGCAVCLTSALCYSCSSGYFVTQGGLCVRSGLLPSLLCGTIAYGNRYYLCASCSASAYNPANSKNAQLCLPSRGSSTLTQLYYYFDPETNAASFSSTPLKVDCSSFSASFIPPPPSSSTVTFSISLGSYYGVAYSAKVFINSNSNSPSTYTLTLTDANGLTDSASASASVQTSCSELLITGTTQFISSPSVTVTLRSSDSTVVFGLSELILTVSVCGTNCLSCANNIYCYICAPPLVLLNNFCAVSCGLLFVQVANGYTSCVSSCSNLYYPVTTPNSRTCTACQSPCNTCLSATACLSCIPALGFYYNDLTNACLGASDACSNGFFKNAAIMACSVCITPCLTCQSSIACLSCSIGFYNQATSNCVGACPSGFYANSVTATCSACTAPCGTCSSQPDYCLTCQTASFFLLNNQCLATCPDGYFSQTSNGASTCQVCDSSCSTCSGSGSSACTSCLFYNLYAPASTSGLCLAVCYAFFYAETQRCKPCALPCNTCSSLNTCLTCSPLPSNSRNVFYLGTCVLPADCPSGYFISTTTGNVVYKSNGDPVTGTNVTGTGVSINNCLPCVAPCRTCQSSLVCLSCLVGYLSNSNCLTLCPDSQYGDSATGTCKACPSTCTLCSSPLICSACVAGNSLQGTACQAECSNSFYSSNSICQQCPSSCTRCLSSIVCTACQSNFFLSGSSCVVNCPITFFGDSTTNLCSNCGTSCQICSSNTVCSRCAPSAFLTNRACVSSANCPDATYPDSTSRTCAACVTPCKNCLSSRTCTSCTDGLFLSTSGTCQGCPSGSYVSANNNGVQVCLACVNQCATCSDSTTCTSCSPNSYLLASSCVTQEVCNSKVGLYPNNQQWRCATCVTPCATCTTQTSCLSCATGFLYQTSCLTICPNIYYAKASTLTCQLCNQVTPASNCLNCYQTNGQETCLSCVASFNLHQGTCIRTCPATTYIDSNIPNVCQPCVAPCATCNSLSVCVTCSFGLFINNQCLASCPGSYFGTVSNGQRVCQSCDSKCLQCSGTATFCVSCPLTSFLLKGACVSSSNCGAGYFPDSRSQMCLLCQSPCSKCTSLTFCLTCSNPQAVIANGVCLSSCPDGQFSGLSNGILSCFKCDASCATCTAGTPSSCLTCIRPQFSILDGICQVCPANMYPNPLSDVCVPCNPPCATCTSISACTTCKDASYLLVITQCLVAVSCPAGTYLQSLTPRSCQSVCDNGTLADPTTNTCVRTCPSNYAAHQFTCLVECPAGFFLTASSTCTTCLNALGQSAQSCTSPLTFDFQIKTYFNQLLLFVRFSSPIIVKEGTDPLSASNFQVNLYPYLSETVVGRRLQTTNPMTPSPNLPASISFIDSQNVHLLLNVSSNLTYQQVEIWAVGVMGRIRDVNGVQLQNSKRTLNLAQFDVYEDETRRSGMRLEGYSGALSIILVVMLLLNFCMNSVYLAYPMIDFYQLLYVVMFVNLEYPPNLNYFFHGFRFAHYLFLPEIFSFNITLQNGPARFATLTPDVNFLRNTGHSFLLLFVVAGVGLLVLALEAVVSRMVHKEGEQALELRNSRLPSLGRFLQSILARFKFNYLNDVVSITYYYFCLFALAQFLDFPGTTGYHYASCFFAIAMLVLVNVLPIFLAVSIYSQHDQILELQSLPALKFALAGIDRGSNLGLGLRLVQYPRKLMGLIVLVFGLKNPLYFFGWSAVTSGLFMVLILIFRPYRWRLQNWCYILLQFCQTVIMCLLSALGLEYQSMSLKGKSDLGWVIVAISIVFTLLLLAYNLAILGAEVLFYFTGVNYLQAWSAAKVADHSVDDSNSENSKQDQPMESNILMVHPKEGPQDEGQDDDNSDQDYNPFLQEGDGAPRILMKCMKTVGAAEEDLSEDDARQDVNQ